MEEKLDRVFSREYLPQWLVAGGIALLILSACMWWTQVYENPYNVWWDMLGNSLSTSSVTSHLVEQTTDGTKVDEYTALQFGVNPLVYGKTTLSTGSNVVNTENIGNLGEDFVRYTNVKTGQKSKDGKALDFSGVLGKWAKESSANTSAQGASMPLFSQTALGLAGGNVIPLADLTTSQRANLLDQLHKSLIFSTDYSKATRGKVNGHEAWIYSVGVESVAYVAYEKAFAHDLGIKALDNTDPNNYQGQQAETISVSVDVRSHQLLQVSYPGGSHKVDYSSYGVPVNQSLPKATISGETLQNLVSNIQ